MRFDNRSVPSVKGGVLMAVPCPCASSPGPCARCSSWGGEGRRDKSRVLMLTTAHTVRRINIDSHDDDGGGGGDDDECV